MGLRSAKARVGMLASGLALFLAHLALAAPAPSGEAERPALLVRVPADATPAEVARRVDEEVLVQAALDLGFAKSDPLVGRRLVANMRFLHGETREDDQALFSAALALGMHKVDPLVRSRLAARVRAVVDRRQLAVDDAALAAFLAAHPEDFALPPAVELTQVFLSRRVHGADLERAATAALERLAACSDRACSPGDGQPFAPSLVGDPLPHVPRRQRLSLAAWNALLGEGFGDALRTLPSGRWLGPVYSAYGAHLVWLHANVAASTPPLDAVRPAVRAALLEERRARAEVERLAQLRAQYAIVLERIP